MIHTITCFISCILDDDIRLVVLEISKRKKDDVSLIDPHLRHHLNHEEFQPSKQVLSTHLLPHLPSNMGQSFFSIEALGFQSAVSQHLCHLRILLSILSEDEFSLVIVVLVLSTSPILSSLYPKYVSIQ